MGAVLDYAYMFITLNLINVLLELIFWAVVEWNTIFYTSPETWESHIKADLKEFYPSSLILRSLLLVELLIML